MDWRRSILVSGVIGMVLLALAAAARAQGSSAPSRRSAGQSTDPAVEKLPPQSDGTSSEDIEDRKVGSNGDGVWRGYVKTLFALAVVIGLIFLVRFLVRRFGGGAAPIGRNQPVEIIARTAVGGKQHLLLVRMGERVVLVGQSVGGMVSLSEITDPEEVGRLVKAAGEGRDTAFSGILKRKSGQFVQSGTEREDEASSGEASALRNVTGRMRGRLPDEKDSR